MKTTLFASLGILLVGFLMAFSEQDSLHLKLKAALADNDEYLQSLEVLDKNVMENAKVLVHNLRSKARIFMETANGECDEMGRCLQTSEDYLTQLQKRTDIAIDEISVAYYAGLHKHYRNAIKARTALKAELSKASPANAALEMNALTIYSEIAQADSEQQAMQKKLNIEEPTIKEQKK